MSLQDYDDRKGPGARVFISYKRAKPDQELAMNIYTALRQQHDVFIDREILVGMQWADRINEALRQADYFVVLLSPQSSRSEMVTGELEIARDLAAERPDRRPRILPVLMSSLTELRYPLSAYFRYVQCAQWSKPEDTETVIEQLLESIAYGCNDDDWPPPTRPVGRPADSSQASAHVELGQLPLPGMPLPSGWPPPQGALPFDTSHYIERPQDGRVYDRIRQPGATISVCGPRQIGKTSLLARVAHQARQIGKQVAWIDFQLFDENVLADARIFYQQFCGRISDMLGIESQVEAFWKDNNGDAFTAERYIDRYVLPRSGPLMLIMDKVERVLEAPLCADFFSMLRSWHDGRALVDNNLQRLDIVLAASTEPKLWIPDPERSPFTVGLRVDLDDFSYQQVQQLNESYGSHLNDHQLLRLMNLLHGHPYLIHHAIYCVANENYDPDSLFERARRDDSPFADHLKHLLLRLSGTPELTQGMRRVLARQTCRDERLYVRLRGAGLVRRKDERRPTHVLPSRQLYHDYFSDRLRPAPSWQPWRIFSW
ncbi:MAG TPA: AAA-like domain-containing protein [Roseiflexaceae bacterium]|nr:AAA-like domain-containing protein [Roseiflexaceae bacterium]